MDDLGTDYTASLLSFSEFFTEDGDYQKRLYKRAYIDNKGQPVWVVQQMRQTFRDWARTLDMDSYLTYLEEESMVQAEIEWIDSHCFGYNPW